MPTKQSAVGKLWRDIYLCSSDVSTIKPLDIFKLQEIIKNNKSQSMCVVYGLLVTAAICSLNNVREIEIVALKVIWGTLLN